MNIALEGLKVLDLTRLLPGAFCTQLLADYGADVLKIEQPGTGDYNRQFAPIAKKESGSFLLLNRNKRSMTLNLKTGEGRDIFCKLVKEADVIVEGFRPRCSSSAHRARARSCRACRLRTSAAARSWPHSASSLRSRRATGPARASSSIFP